MNVNNNKHYLAIVMMATIVCASIICEAQETQKQDELSVNHKSVVSDLFQAYAVVNDVDPKMHLKRARLSWDNDPLFALEQVSFVPLASDVKPQFSKKAKKLLDAKYEMLVQSSNRALADDEPKEYEPITVYKFYKRAAREFEHRLMAVHNLSQVPNATFDYLEDQSTLTKNLIDARNQIEHFRMEDAEYFYQNGIYCLEDSTNKTMCQKAYGHFERVESYIPGYKNVEQLSKRAKMFGTSNISLVVNAPEVLKSVFQKKLVPDLQSYADQNPLANFSLGKSDSTDVVLQFDFKGASLTKVEDPNQLFRQCARVTFDVHILDLNTGELRQDKKGVYGEHFFAGDPNNDLAKKLETDKRPVLERFQIRFVMATERFLKHWFWAAKDDLY